MSAHMNFTYVQFRELGVQIEDSGLNLMINGKISLLFCDLHER